MPFVPVNPPGGGGASALSELTDVDLTGVVDGNVLTYATGSGLWVPQTPGALSAKMPYDFYMESVGGGQYRMYDREGSLVEDETDTGTASALKFIVEEHVADNIHVHFGPGRFHLLDAPVGNEAWANTETKLSFTDARGVTFTGEGMYTSTISMRTNTTAPSPDVATLLFTRCAGWTIQDLNLEMCGEIVTTMETFNANQGTEMRLERVRIPRSKGRGLVIDGGDAGAYAGSNFLHHCLIQGRPRRPEINLAAGGSLTADTDYRYCYSWEDMDLAGANTAAETMPSDWTHITTNSSSKSISVVIQTGPYTVTARHIYRWDASNGWQKVQTINDNTTTVWVDDGSATPSAPPADFTAHRSTIYQSGFELLSCQDSLIDGCIADGVGDWEVGVNQYGFNIARKGTKQQPLRNKITNCIALGTGKAGFRVFGGSNNIFANNICYNPNIPSQKGQFFRVEGTTDTPTDNNLFLGFIGIDDRDADSPDGGGGVLNAYSIVTNTFVPDNTMVIMEKFEGNLSNPADGGTNTVTYSRVGHTHAGVDANLVFPRNVAGQYYATASQSSWTTAADFTAVPNTLYGSSIFFTDVTTIDDMQIEFRANKTTGSVFRFVIFEAEDIDGMWSTLVYESADISLAGWTTPVFKSDNPNFTTEAQHRYFFGIVSDSDWAFRTVQPINSQYGYNAPATTPTKINSLSKAIGTAWQTGSVGNGPASPSFSNSVPLIFVRAST